MGFETFILGLILLIVVVAVLRSVRIINQYEKGLIIRLGKYSSTADSGIVFLMPFIDSLIVVDMREQVMSVEPQTVITKDNVTVLVDAVIYYKVVDPVKAEFEVQDFGLAATILAQTNLRNLIGDKSLDETLVARDSINTNLRNVIDEATHGWGVKVTRVELQKIDPPVDITTAMSQQMKAEREKRARILEAQGFREAAILKAQGEAQAIEMVAKAAEKNFTNRAALLRQLEVTEKVLGGDSTKFIIPANSSIVNVLGLNGKSSIVPIMGKK